MKDIKFENANLGLCIVCGRPVTETIRTFCLTCRRVCKPVNITPIPPGVKHMVMEVKSDCCNADVTFLGNVTCSDICHEEFVIASEKEWGMFKQCVDETTGIAYKVPTRDIIENGVTQTGLSKYPKWED